MSQGEPRRVRRRHSGEHRGPASRGPPRRRRHGGAGGEAPPAAAACCAGARRLHGPVRGDRRRLAGGGGARGRLPQCRGRTRTRCLARPSGSARSGPTRTTFRRRSFATGNAAAPPRPRQHGANLGVRADSRPARSTRMWRSSRACVDWEPPSSRTRTAECRHPPAPPGAPLAVMRPICARSVDSRGQKPVTSTIVPFGRQVIWRSTRVRFSPPTSSVDVTTGPFWAKSPRAERVAELDRSGSTAT